jgi:hypothetical protein
MIHISKVLKCPYCQAGDDPTILWWNPGDTVPYRVYHIVQYEIHSKEELCTSPERFYGTCPAAEMWPHADKK